MVGVGNGWLSISRWETGGSRSSRVSPAEARAEVVRANHSGENRRTGVSQYKREAMEILLKKGVNVVLEACIALRWSRDIRMGDSQAMVMMGFANSEHTIPGRCGARDRGT